ncbi:hypothetical protein SLS62_007366 [Diatrype stigma]|uniref:Uncharacterized protein n=1 Tax=Diatrype stigma TaxID=117547 RepID=A0AAN9YNE9_9PEZI
MIVLPIFGDPNPHPPTPKETPTSTVLPSPVFETPKNNQGSFDESGSGGWTPRFAEEFSVFNSTPGNLAAPQGQFLDFSTSTTYLTSLGHKSPSSAENIAVQIASHVNHLSPNPNLPLPPVHPSRRLLSSPGPPATEEEANQPGSQQTSIKKVCRATAQEDLPQTATPPPSGRGRERRIAPKVQTDTMQDDQVFGQEFVVDAQQQQNMAGFVTSPTDMFGYPMSAPATAPFADSRSFWDTDMGGMDIDFTAAGTDVFQTSNHRPMNSLDWGKQNQMFQDTGALPQQHQPNRALPAKKERALAPKPPMAHLDTATPDMAMFNASFPTPVEDSFVMMNQGNGVDPGLLFTRPPSSSMDAAMFDPMAQAAPMPSFSQPELVRSPVKKTMKGELRRSASTKDTVASRKIDRSSASSPVKGLGRPGLSRSASETRGRKPLARASLPTLAPAIKPTPQQNAPRSLSQAARPSASGRTSPLKNPHSRLSSLGSIPEATTPRVRTSVKFTIDSRGRARAETTTVIEDGDEGNSAPTVIRSRKEGRSRSRSKQRYSSEDDESSTDDEPIIIPSRNSSFALPEARNNPSFVQQSFSSQHSISEQQQQGASSLGIYYSNNNDQHHQQQNTDHHNDGESDAETVMNWPESGRGDAASELRKVVENRQKKISLNTSQRFLSGPPYSSSNTISPTTLDGGSLPTPSTDRGSQIRCICKSTNSRVKGNGYLRILRNATSRQMHRHHAQDTPPDLHLHVLQSGRWFFEYDGAGSVPVSSQVFSVV